MALPKIDVPIFTVTLPATEKQISLRPFTVKEEKILLMANETKSAQEILTAIKQIANNCIIDDDVSIDTLPLVDLQFIFIHLRSKSVGNVAEISIRDEDDGQTYQVSIDLESYTIDRPEVQPSNVVMLNEAVGITLKYPTIELANIPSISTEDLLMICLVNIFDEDQVYEVADVSEEELREFIGGMTTNHIEKIKTFLEGLPSIQYTINYTTEAGDEKTLTIKNINDFF